MSEPASTRVLLPTASNADTWATTRALIRGRMSLTVVTAFVVIAGTVLSLISAPLLGRIVDIVVDDGSSSDITRIALLLAAAAIGAGVLRAVGLALVARLAEAMLADLREQVVEHGLQLPLEILERAGVGDLVSRIGGDVRVVSDAARNAIPLFLVSGLTIGLTIIGMGVLDWRIGLAGLVASPIQLATLRWYLPRSAPVYAAERVAEGARAQQIISSVEGATTVRSLRAQAEHLDEITRRSQETVRLEIRANYLRTRFWARLNGAEFVGTSAVLIVGFLLVRDDAITLGTATAGALYFVRLFDPINIVLGLFDTVQSAAAGMARLVGVTRVPMESKPSVRAAQSGAIVVSGVGHEYQSGHAVLHDIDLAIAPGERIALVGPSGAGKSTLARLIAGVYEPTRGSVEVHATDATGAPSPVRPLMVTQEVHVFAGTLREDLLLARAGASDDELGDVLEQVGASDWAATLPAGLDTRIGDGALALDALRSQQLAMARVLLADPAVVILDEATAEAGSAGARVLDRATQTVTAGRTAVVIAHRLSQAVGADRIVVIDDGRITEIGTHHELLHAGGRYAHLWSAWSSNRAADERR